MANDLVCIYGLQLKRVALALAALHDGIVASGSFSSTNGIPAALGVPANLPSGFAESDYTSAQAAETDSETLYGLSNTTTFVTKFAPFDGGGLNDPQDLLGKKFDQG